MEYGAYESEENMGVLGRVYELTPEMTPVEAEDQPEPAAAERDVDAARKHQLSQMAANMIVHDEPRGSYFVRRPGL